MRRRTLLLQEKSVETVKNDENFRKKYLQLRSTILHEKYGVPKDILCSRSPNLSLNGSSAENQNIFNENYIKIYQMLDHVNYTKE